MWGANASICQVFENFESAGGERNGTMGVKRSGVTIALDDRNDQAGQADGTTAKRKTRLKKESRR